MITVHSFCWLIHVDVHVDAISRPTARLIDWFFRYFRYCVHFRTYLKSCYFLIRQTSKKKSSKDVVHVDLVPSNSLVCVCIVQMFLLITDLTLSVVYSSWLNESALFWKYQSKHYFGFCFFVCVVFVFLFFSDTSFSTGISYRKGETRVSRSFLQRVFSISTLIMFVGQGWRSDENTHLWSHRCSSGSNPGADGKFRLGLLFFLALVPRGFSPDTPGFPSP